MHAIMYIAILGIMVMTVGAGYNAGMYGASFALFRSFLAFMIAFTFFLPLAGLVVAAVPYFGVYPWPGYLEALFFAVFFVGFIVLSDHARFKYFVSTADIHINRYADRIGGGLMGLCNGIVLSGFVLILWAILPFVSFIPSDVGRVQTDRLPVDSGAILLQVYAHSSARMGGGHFPLEDVEDAQEGMGESWQRGALRYYRTHSDISQHDIDRIMDDE